MTFLFVPRSIGIYRLGRIALILRNTDVDWTGFIRDIRWLKTSISPSKSRLISEALLEYAINVSKTERITWNNLRISYILKIQNGDTRRRYSLHHVIFSIHRLVEYVQEAVECPIESQLDKT